MNQEGNVFSALAKGAPLLAVEDLRVRYGGIEALPTTFLIGRDGKIAATHVGLTGKDEFEDGIKKLMGASGIVQERASAGLTNGFAPALLFRAK